LSRIPAIPRALRSAARLLGYWGARYPLDAFWIWQGFRDNERDRLYTPGFRSRLGVSDPAEYIRKVYRNADGLDDVDRALQVGVETYLPDDLLVKVDIASMANSLEPRSPLLDHRVLEFAAGLRASRHVGMRTTKRLLKGYAARLLPASIIRRPKQGFAVPLASWLRGPLRRSLITFLQHPRFTGRGYFDGPAVRSLIDRHLAGEEHGSRLWALLWLELWFRMFIDGDLRRDDRLEDVA